MNLQHWLDNYILDPYNPYVNFNLGLCYDELGQTSSAAGYYLRSIEFGNNDNHIYEALLRMALCFEKQGSRVFTTTGVLLRAISLLPKRPEGYFLLSRLYERNKSWHESYTMATIGYEFATNEPNTKTDVEYPGKWGFIFEKAVVGWWIGLIDESIYLFRELKRNYNLPYNYKITVENNINNLGNTWKSPIEYNYQHYSGLRFKFDGAKDIQKNYSQCHQDLFVLSILNGKRNGTFLEIGCADPFYGNNTALLEQDFDWTGISIDIDNDSINKFNQHRKSHTILQDATKIDYTEILTNEIIDYLQIDCDPPTASYEVLEKIPFHKYKFRVITFEHDYYIDDTQSIRDKSRRYLESFGYKLIVNNIAPDNYCSYEDWYVHPDLVDNNIINIMTCINDNIKRSDKYILNNL
jgi:hypothetical protein